jgi:glycosyltransferase involved in cell wall biosynthesis
MNVNLAQRPALSVITPVRNAAAFIEACLRNVIDQDCPEAEHIIVDGQSQDSTVSILEAFARKYPHIRYLSEPDRGQSDALNKGLRLARATVIGILNADDYYEPGVLRHVVKRFREFEAPGLLVGNCRVLDQDGRPIGVNRPSCLAVDRLLLGPEFVEFPCNPSAYFYHRQLHDLVGGYDESDHYAMDLDFLLRAIPRARTAYEDEIWGNYRLHPGSKTLVEMAAGRSMAHIDAVITRHLRRVAPFDRARITVKRALLRFFLHNKLRLLHVARRIARPFRISFARR